MQLMVSLMAGGGVSASGTLRVAGPCGRAVEPLSTKAGAQAHDGGVGC
jgi:hypothetical protein